MTPLTDPTQNERTTTLRGALAASWQVIRPILGWSLIALGVLGCILPVLPGLPLLFIGIALVGRRSKIIRWCAVQYKLAVRRWAAMPHPWLARAGRWALLAQQETSRQRRRLVWWHQGRRMGTFGQD